jgi:hypothetical protein
MGGYGSGNSTGRPTADASLRVDIGWMIRTRRVVPGSLMSGTLHWTLGGEPSGSISYRADMLDCTNAKLTLIYTRGSGDGKEDVRQDIRLTSTSPHYGGSRWWMICPFRGHRVGKLYLPGGGDRFASRKAWRLGYQSQRTAWHDRPFARVQRIQARLGCRQGYEEWIRRPKGMWHRTFARHWAEFEAANKQCDRIMDTILARLGGSR